MTSGVWELFLISLPLPAPHPHPPMREVLPTSAAGHHICNGLQGWPQLRLIPDVDSPGMCLLSNCPAPERSRPPPLCGPLLYPSEHAGPFLLSHSLWRHRHSQDQGKPDGGHNLLQPSPSSWGTGGLSPFTLFFSWWERGSSGKLTRGERIWLCSTGFPNPWPFLGMPLTSPASLMERTAPPWARPAPQRLPNDSLVG